KQADKTKPEPGSEVRLRQFYIDREFDRFSLHEAFVRPLPGNRAELHHDWLAGIADVTLDSAHRMLTYSRARTTYRVSVTRPTEPADVGPGATQFAARESSTGGAKQLSVRDTVRATVGDAAFMVDYGRPLARGRVLLGDVIPYDNVWRTGANAAT